MISDRRLASIAVTGPGLEIRSMTRAVKYPTMAIPMIPRAGIRAEARSDHCRVSGGWSERTMNRYICAFAVTPAVQKAVIRSGTYTVAGTGPPKAKAVLPAMSRYTTKIAAKVDRLVPTHLNRTPRRAFMACAGPYSSEP